MAFTPPGSPEAAGAGPAKRPRQERPFSGARGGERSGTAPMPAAARALPAPPGGCTAGDGGAAAAVDETCWLCHYQSDDEAKRLMEFIARSVGYIDIHNISAQVASFIVERYANVKDKAGNPVSLKGAEPADVERHMRNHVLHPKVRISVIIQELLAFKEHLRKNLVVEDVATGMTAVDKGNVELYLKVISQVMQLYKSETGAMLFGSDET